jgi:hypothetical protein
MMIDIFATQSSRDPQGRKVLVVQEVIAKNCPNREAAGEQVRQYYIRHRDHMRCDGIAYRHHSAQPPATT